MRLPRPLLALTATFSLLAGVSAEITVTVSNVDSVKTAAASVASNMMSYYTGNESGQIPGELPEPYYWWEAGAMFGTLVEYWYYTGDTTYNDEVTQALQFQVGPDMNYMPPNQSKDEGNDDQVFWGFAAMSAAEFGFPNPPSDEPQWLALAQGVWNSQQLRWDTSTCGGGLRWQIYEFNDGYTYKNAPSNAGFMNLGARLYAYTDNSTYATWVEKEWDWMTDIGIIGGSCSYYIYDGTSTPNNCTTLDHIQWTYSAGMAIHTAAVMWNKTQNDTWKTRAQGMWDCANVFFKDSVMYEPACEPVNNCDTDQLSFKAYLSRFLAASTKVAPWLYDDIFPYLSATASAVALSCNAGSTGSVCGEKWTVGDYDGSTGVGQQMSALSALQSTLITDAKYPVSESTGGTSTGDPSAGTDSSTTTTGDVVLSTISTGDRAAAGILTAVVLVFMLGGTWWLIT